MRTKKSKPVKDWSIRKLDSTEESSRQIENMQITNFMADSKPGESIEFAPHFLLDEDESQKYVLEWTESEPFYNEDGGYFEAIDAKHAAVIDKIINCGYNSFIIVSGKAAEVIHLLRWDGDVLVRI